jgi:hypothetical protein
MISESAKNEFWTVVQECLVSFFDFDAEKAAKVAKCLREKAEPSGDIFYHAEPYDVACGIANGEPSEKHLEKYVAMLGEHGW